MRSAARFVLSALSVALIAWPARADDVEQAKALFSAGAAAYDKHDYLGAIRAFEGAQHLAPRPPIVFSLAQAHRRQFYVDGDVAHQRAAIDLFRGYVKDVPSGGRHEDAMRALQELGALAPPQQDVASVSVNSSGTPGARVALDGAAPVDAPLIGPVSAGKHRAVISAEGFVSETREITAINGQIVALDVPLKEKPAQLAVNAPDGASVDIDGRPMGTTPVSSIELAPGPHVIAIAKNGHDAYVDELDLGRGEQRRVDAPLPATKQRHVAVGMLIASAVAVAGAGVCAGFAGYYFGVAEGVLNKQRTQLIDANDVATYDDARAMRGGFLIATGVAFAGAAVLAATGLVLFVFDKPSTSAPKLRREKPATPNKAEPGEFSVAPMLSPNGFGASALVRF